MKKSLCLAAPTLPRGAETLGMSAEAPSDSIVFSQAFFSIDKVFLPIPPHEKSQSAGTRHVLGRNRPVLGGKNDS